MDTKAIEYLDKMRAILTFIQTKQDESIAAAAQKLADEITNTLPENAKMRWVHKIYWGAVYLRGCCLQAQGDVSAANSLKQSALSKEPRLDIQNRVRAK